MLDRTTKLTTNSKAARWPLQDAKARFSELVRKAQTDGPQRVTIHGRDTVVVLSEQDYTRLSGHTTGQALIDVMAKAPLDEFSFDVPRARGKARAVELE